jgi:phosphoenolpyruvate carboxylase
MESPQQDKNNKMDLISNNDPLDKNRLLIEDLWEAVLREECPEDQAVRLIQLKELSYSKQIDGVSSKTFKNEIVDIINSMDLAESIAAARAFSLYFQLVNILEQRVEEDRYIQSFTNMNVQKSPDNLDPFAPALARQNAPVTFRELFYRLRKLNVPPGKLEELLQEMDIRLVFTALRAKVMVCCFNVSVAAGSELDVRGASYLACQRWCRLEENSRDMVICLR